MIKLKLEKHRQREGKLFTYLSTLDKDAYKTLLMLQKQHVPRGAKPSQQGKRKAARHPPVMRNDTVVHPWQTHINLQHFADIGGECRRVFEKY
jgi:hypothetical protein